jgi:diguanylate cyclase (GGDEF)-like protein
MAPSENPRQLTALNDRLIEVELERAEIQDRLSLIVALQDAFGRIASAREARHVIAETLRAARVTLGFSRAIHFTSRGLGVAVEASLDDREHVAGQVDLSDCQTESILWHVASDPGRCCVGLASDLYAPLVDVRNWFVLAPLDGAQQAHGFLYVDGHPSPEPREWESQLVQTLAAVATVSLDSARALESTNALAMRDPLTDLFNRRAFEDRLRQEIESCRRYDKAVAFVLIDVDDFKRINDSFGHAYGDGVLKSVAKTLNAATRSEDVVGRLAGDEFVVILVNTDPKLAHQMVVRLSTQLTANGLRCSLGTALFPRDASDAEGLLKAADEALYAAKAAGKNRYAFR